MHNTSDDVLLKAAAGGDERAFTILFRRYQQAVFHFACRMTGSIEAAEDVTQECFMRVLRSAERFDPARGSLRTYLYATARNLAVREAQKPSSEQARRQLAAEMASNDRHADAGFDVAHMPDAAPGPEGLLLGIEASEVVRTAVRMLPAAQREALVLIEYEDLSLVEAAQVLAIDAGAVKSRLHRARENLKKLLAPYFGSQYSSTQRDEL